MASLFAVRREAGHPAGDMSGVAGCARFILLLALGACAGGGAGKNAGAKAPPTEDARQFYPLETGWKWAYDVEKGGERILAIYSVIERRGETAVLQAGEERISYVLLPDGVARRPATKELPQGDYLLRTPIRVGAKWPIEGGTATVTEAGLTVDVPGGNYQGCAVVEESRSEPTRLVRTTYAPGAGPVIIEYLVHDQASGRFEPALKAALRGVTAPGADPLLQ